MNGQEGNPIRILVVAASSERRHHLAAIANRSTHACARLTARLSPEETIQATADLLLVDVNDPSMSNALIRVAESLPAGTGIIALADNPDSQWVAAALRTGVNAILSRELTVEEMRLAIQATEAGLVLLHPSSAQDLSGRALIETAETSPLVEELTQREREVLRLAGEGLGNKEIAARLNISGHTVKFHISSILGKLGAASRTEAVSQGIRRGLIAI